jgi:copper chaperone
MEPAMMNLKVDEMSCGHSVSTVRKAAETVNSIAQVSVYLPTSTVTVESAASEGAITDAIRSAGYPAKRLAA